MFEPETFEPESKSKVKGGRGVLPPNTRHTEAKRPT